MIAAFLNKLARRKTARTNALACLVCPHVVTDLQAIRFLCRTQEGYAGSCDENCRAFQLGEHLGVIHLGHVLASDPVLLDLGGLPINVALHRSGDIWTAGYYPDDYEAVEGDIVAPPSGDRLLRIDDQEEFFVFALSETRLVTANLDDGFQIVPFWKTKDESSEFGMHLLGSEQLVKLTYGQIRKLATENGVWFLAPGFLCRKVDRALIARGPGKA